jgi:CheY-like chemotaxis protein
VLIVDDDADTRRLYEYALALFGMDVVAAASADAALREVAAHLPNIVVTDLAMPGMDGIAFCKALKARKETRDIPVLAVSGQALEALETRARAAGCREVLMKPCEPDALFATISRVLADARQIAEQSRALREDARRIRKTVRLDAEVRRRSRSRR